MVISDVMDSLSSSGNMVPDAGISRPLEEVTPCYFQLVLVDG